jgi:hypothetical protein
MLQNMSNAAYNFRISLAKLYKKNRWFLIPELRK